MADYPSSHGAAEHLTEKTSTATIGWIILASVMCGVGLFLLADFLVFFAWWAFSGVVLVIVGAVIFFKTWTGPESA